MLSAGIPCGRSCVKSISRIETYMGAFGGLITPAHSLILRLVTLSMGERRPLPCINFKDSTCPAELPRWLSW